ncbi:MAG: FAD-linked oxidase C-terminal domain-containing protein, partial [Candidatus Acidiferrales bacterium]
VREFARLAREHSAAATITRIALLPAAAAAVAGRLAAIADAHNLEAALALGAAGSAGTGYVALWPRSPGAANDQAQASLAAAIKEILEAASNGAGAARGFVEWCPTALKRRISLWGDAREDFVLMQRVKNIFDPHGALAPGRYCGGL